MPLPTEPLDPLSSDLRTLLSSLRSSADADTCEVLASATNTYLSAILRFRGAGTFGAGDVRALLGIWQTLLDVPKANPEAYAPRPKAVPTGEEETLP